MSTSFVGLVGRALGYFLYWLSLTRWSSAFCRCRLLFSYLAIIGFAFSSFSVNLKLTASANHSDCPYMCHRCDVQKKYVELLMYVCADGYTLVPCLVYLQPRLSASIPVCWTFLVHIFFAFCPWLQNFDPRAWKRIPLSRTWVLYIKLLFSLLSAVMSFRRSFCFSLCRYLSRQRAYVYPRLARKFIIVCFYVAYSVPVISAICVHILYLFCSYIPSQPKSIIYFC